jgi:hypothetical protein
LILHRGAGCRRTTDCLSTGSRTGRSCRRTAAKERLGRT